MEHQVALSFAGEDRAYVEIVAEELRARGVSVFYDRYEEVDLWGKDLYVHLSSVYRNKAQYTLMFISRHYQQKVWPNHERRAAQSRALDEGREYILPARFDDTEIPGLLPTTGFIDLRTHSPAQVARLVCEKLGRPETSIRADQVPPPKSPVLVGEARFNYSNFNGHFRIGEGTLEFNTHWSKASNTSIHCYTDSTNLRGLALAPRGITLAGIPPIEDLEFTSRVRSPEVGRFVVLQNVQGFYAALQIVEVKDDTRGDAEDSLHFKYWILPDGSAQFAQLVEC
ncbi:TIR domain-containing protein [Acidithiobacillus sp. AMEEHan]|uniref:toll/interleukin-1 receptor domain-containing protein n=1 Tax=Acidithiobacillus sp. AMEEHan TaxID=2994951 RepID=UPI0027E57D07|nr:TIR domain-containing protein [Acidithiobacillus sp. AMEEHan]